MVQRAKTLMGPVVAVAVILSISVRAEQTPADSGRPSSKPRTTTMMTGSGVPDLSGVWVFRTATPLQRPEALKDKPLLTDAEVTRLRERARRLGGNLSNDAPPGDQLYLAVLGDVREYRNVNSTQTVGLDTSVVDRDFDSRTSLIIDPPDGRIPALTKEGQGRQASNAARSFNLPVGPPAQVSDDNLPVPAGPRDLSNPVRCITWGVPRLGGNAFYTSHYQIVQTPDHIAIVQEVNHDVRIIPLDGRPQLSPGIRQWNGDSRGRWEGQTLVVDTTNFSPDSFSSDPLRTFTWSNASRVALQIRSITRSQSLTPRHGRDRGQLEFR